MFRTKNYVSAVKWMDNKPVHFLSNFLSPKETTTIDRKKRDGSKEKVSCPQVVEMYNKIMGGVDRFDQLLERYSIGRRANKWWHRIFYYLLDMAIVNAYILMKINKRSKIDQLTFRLNLARQLISGYSSRKRRFKSVNFLSNKREHMQHKKRRKKNKIHLHTV